MVIKMTVKLFDFSGNDKNVRLALEIIKEQNQVQALQNEKLIENQTVLTQLLQDNVQKQIQKQNPME